MSVARQAVDEAMRRLMRYFPDLTYTVDEEEETVTFTFSLPGIKEYDLRYEECIAYYTLETDRLRVRFELGYSLGIRVCPQPASEECGRDLLADLPGNYVLTPILIMIRNGKVEVEAGYEKFRP